MGTKRNELWTESAEVHFLRTRRGAVAAAERAFATYDTLTDPDTGGRAPEIWDLDLFILQAPHDGIADQLGGLGDWVASVTVFGQVRDALRIAERVDGDGAAFLVNIDVFGPLEQAVDVLLSLRRTNPMLTILVMSSEFVRDDTSLERSAIADTSLRLPCTPERLRDGLFCAAENTKLRQLGLAL
ncbi:MULTISPECIES: hypothetical protein [Mameliella]|uniref:Response regulator n=1 Tax=Mameliella alba TaxID=561184 RepID=A0A0B3S114_9RHOB|nr:MULTISPECIES: hypothetical protein [Mameliella]MCR9272027.1 hypothetical protein [Paracoccaceae bacterium]KHQ53997.1 hypothetical protein OA50_01225 [Mameliella alba]MBY6119718.1 hypothetical protein [Mameliella alba]OWV45547.1 hypothetical protein CDZ95_00855 [Mameliella alba]OWV62771.1 hypothetical protein CDZ98_00885 [Mameliella alba]